jgi:hypothetical protein
MAAEGCGLDLGTAQAGAIVPVGSPGTLAGAAVAWQLIVVTQPRGFASSGRGGARSCIGRSLVTETAFGPALQV